MRLIYLSPVSWGSFSQRPHKFVHWFHGRHDCQVLWIDPYPTRLPRLRDLGRDKFEDKSPVGLAQNETPDWLEVLVPRALPIEPIPGVNWLNHVLWGSLLRVMENFIVGHECVIVVGKPSALALDVLTRFPNVETIYDAMDDFPCFYGGISRLSMARKERALAARANWIIASSTMLTKRFTHYSRKLITVRNACDADLPAPSPYREHPPRIAPTGHYTLGYVGTIGAWFDWHAVLNLAQSTPEYLIRLVGPLYNPPPHKLPTNIELVPACSHAEAIRHMQTFAVGLIPFKLTELTASVDPIKYYEYRALGLPVISTRFGEMSLRDNEPGVFLFDASSDLGQIAERAITYADDELTIKQFRQHNTWPSRFETAYELLDQLRG